MELKWLIPALAVSGQIRPEDVATLKGDGIKQIINNRPDGEEPDQPSSAAIAKAAADAGLDYAYVPIAKTGPTQRDAVEFARALHASDGTTLAYCRTGNRSEATWRLIGEMQTAQKRG